MAVIRYLGIRKEGTFGTKVAPLFYVDKASSTLDTPTDPELIKPGGLTRFAREHAPGAYIPAGGVEFVCDMPLLYYFIELCLGTNETTDNTTEEADEATASDASGIIDSTLANLPVVPGSVMIENDTPLEEAHDDGFGIIHESTLVTDEAHATGAGITTLDFTLTKKPVAPRTFKFYNAVPTLVAVDDGFGLIVQDGASGVTGTIDYETGAVTLAGLTASIAYTADYSEFETASTITGTIDYVTGELDVTGATASHAYTTTYYHGTFSHAITPSNSLTSLSSTMKMGKDEFMHTFTGCAINSMTLAVEREWVTISLDILSQKDEKETITAVATVNLPQGYPTAFHKATMKRVDYGGTLADISSTTEGFTLTITNNCDADGGVTIGSRHCRRIWNGEMEVSLTANLTFDGTEELQAFWGGATAPAAEGTTEQAVQFTLTGNNLGSTIFDLYKCIFTAVQIQPSGRDRIVQAVTLKAFYDASQSAMIAATSTSVYDYA